MNWFNKLLKSMDDDRLLAEQSGNSDVKPPKADKDISEPIISFVKCVQENPKRFKVTQDYDFSMPRWYYQDRLKKESVALPELPDDYYYSMKDLKTKESWTLCGGSGGRVSLFSYRQKDEGKHTSNPEWLTQDERVYLINSIKTIFKNREGRKERVAQLRKERRVRVERNRLKDIYCG